MTSKYQTLMDIQTVKRTFSTSLAKHLGLIPVPTPLFVSKSSGLNDNLNGVERPVEFLTKHGEDLEVVHSLAKWKRYALGKFEIEAGHGILTDMRAIRRDEDLDAIHSYYVDQWDWEKHILKEQRSLSFLKATVEEIYQALKATEDQILEVHPELTHRLPDQVTFISSQELEDQYPSLSPAEREDQAAQQYGAIFVIGIGKKLASGSRHDLRAPDYDDWDLNGDLIVDNPISGHSLELSSMGIRVDKDSLVKQLKECDCTERLELPFHQQIMKDQLPLSIGGGIGQSRVCMFMLGKEHIAQVQPSVWTSIKETVSPLI